MIRFVRRFLPYLGDYLGRFAAAAFGMLLFSAGSAGIAYMVKPLLNRIFIEQDRAMLALLPLALVAAGAAMGFGKYVQMVNTAYIGEDMVRRLREELLERLVGLDLAFFTASRGGELISRVTNDIARIRLAVSQDAAVIVRESLVIVALIGVAFWQSPLLAGLGLVALPLAAAPLVLLARRLKRLSHRSQEKDSDITARLSEIFNNMELIKSHAAEERELERFRVQNLEFLRINLRNVRTRELTSPIMETLGGVAGAGVILFGGLQVIEGRLDAGTFFSVTAALGMLYTPLKRVTERYSKMLDAVAASERVFDMIAREPAIRSGSRRLEWRIGEVAFDGVTLRYGETAALNGVDLVLRRGERVALVGDSGGGKTSIVNLLLRLYDPGDGVVRIDGVDLRELDIRSLRDRIGVVGQRVQIFNDTVAVNVAYGSPLEPERVRDALGRAGALGFVERLPAGVETVIGEFGATLSGGERQRLAIARALYKDPDILILDEATSALDTATEAAILEALAPHLGDKITVMIAHRLSTLTLADRVVVVGGGRILADGPEPELRRTCPDYQRLVHAGDREQPAVVTRPA